MRMQHNRVWATVDLDVFLRNLEAIRGNLKRDVPIISVIKADGYGHGATALAREMETLDYVGGYAVATVEEGILLRRSGIRKGILILGYTFPDSYEDIARYDLSATVFTEEMAEQMNRAALSCKKRIRVHVAVDTGMSRIGVWPDETGAAFVSRLTELGGLELAGLFTHFARADETDKTAARAQLSSFLHLIELVQKRGIRIPYCHCSNSAGILELPEANLDAVRAGIILYGLWPSEEVDRQRVPLEPILSLHSRIAFIKELGAGREISYGGTFRTTGLTRVATVPVGYADGYPRQLSNRGEVLICGKRARILGRVCMDQFMADVTDIPEAAIGSLVTLIGGQEGSRERITMEELGALSGRFNYELACCLGRRVPRIYKKGGQIVSCTDLLGETP